MVEELTAHRTAALRIELARNPGVALAATVHTLALSLLYVGDAKSCLDIRATSDRLERHTKGADESPAHRAMQEEGERWGEQLPRDEADRFAWCLAQPQAVLLDLLAYVSALTVDAVEVKHGRPKAHAGELAQALSLDMTQWWTPSAEGFYSRVPKAMLALAVSEAKVGPLGVSLANLKKAEAARLAAGALAGSGWLPEPLRSPAPLRNVAA
jgi:ParB family transcriptional regulator, chromosome partitioning protein